MSAQSTQTLSIVNGFQAYTLRSEGVEIQVVPGMGAKITSLKSLATGREWLWRAFDPPRFFLNRPGDDFGLSPLIGVDECIPSVGPCEWQGRKIADHGEVWFLPWDLDEEAWKNGAILTRVVMPVSPFRLERSIRLEGDEIQFDYRLTNLGRAVEAYLWAIHPLFTIRPGDRVELPGEVHQVRVFGTEGYEDNRSNVLWDWPKPAVGVHLDDLDRFGDGRSVKLFVDHMPEGRAAIVNTVQRERLRLLWDVHENPALGIWICNGAWNGYYQMALEPTNAGAEYLAEAGERPDAFRPVQAGETVRWQLRMGFDRW